MDDRLGRLLAPLGDRTGNRQVAEHERLGAHQTGLGAAEADDIDARGGQGPAGAGEAVRAVAPRHEGVGQPGAVDVDGHAGGVRGVAHGGQLVDRVHGARLGRLGDRHDVRGVARRQAGGGVADVIRCELAVDPRVAHQAARR